MRRRRARLPGPPVRGEPALVAGGVGVALGGQQLVADVDLTVRFGELVALVGPNGAGKSTLLAALAGDVACSGSVTLGGGPAAGWSAVESAMRRSVMPQHHEVSFPFTVRQVVDMGRAPWRGTSRDRRDGEVVHDALEEARVAHLAGRTAPTLSGGERARVAFARVLAQQADVMLLDEPTASLDLRHQELVLASVTRHVAQGGAALVVLHDLNLAAAYAGRVVVLDGGRVAADGPPAGVLTPAVLEPVYRHPLVSVAEPGSDRLLVVPRRQPSGVAFHDTLS